MSSSTSQAVDPADVSVSTTRDERGAVTSATDAINRTDDQQGVPSTSSGAGRRQFGESASASDPLRRPRKSLPFLPRTTQYERHPLLQMRSAATGLSEFELLMLERDADERPRRMSVETSTSPSTRGKLAGAGRPALVPRSAHSETHPLFVRSADSGISELEEYLKEISQLTPPPARKSSTSVQGRSSMSAATARPTTSSPSSSDDSKTTPTPRKLEPRTSQCERHALLEIKDESGLSELERLLMEKNNEAAAAAAAAAAGGTDGLRCTVCGAQAASPRCDCSVSRRTNRVDGVNADRLHDSDTTSSDSAQQKRVRFMQQRQKTEPGDVAQLERTVSDCAAAKANSVDSSSSKKQTKSRSSKGRGAGVRADSTPAELATAHRKSCCVS